MLVVSKSIYKLESERHDVYSTSSFIEGILVYVKAKFKVMKHRMASSSLTIFSMVHNTGGLFNAMLLLA